MSATHAILIVVLAAVVSILVALVIAPREMDRPPVRLCRTNLVEYGMTMMEEEIVMQWCWVWYHGGWPVLVRQELREDAE